MMHVCTYKRYAMDDLTLLLQIMTSLGEVWNKSTLSCTKWTRRCSFLSQQK